VRVEEEHPDLVRPGGRVSRGILVQVGRQQQVPGPVSTRGCR
jgi:hypothetical protein